jgi:hypothetical protein
MKKFLSLLSIIIFTFVSCDDPEINFGEESLIENQPNFQVDFDNQTYTADYVEASIVDGVTILKAYKTSTKEYVVIVLNKDIEGEFTFSPNDNIGKISYKKDEDDTFFTSPTAFSGRVDLVTIDYQKMKLFGAFSFIGVRMIPALDDEGNLILDENDNPTYEEEIKNFTNGHFENIEFSNVVSVDSNIEPEPEPTTDTFFMKIDEEEFVETTLSAEKLTIDGVAVIQIRATNDGSNHVFKLQMPANVVFGSSHLLLSDTTNPGEDSLASYRIISTNETFVPYSGGTINLPILQIISHDTATNKIVGTFEFSGELGNGDTKQFTEGAFSVTYTE